jgi:putrescine---pyruvate transaminase
MGQGDMTRAARPSFWHAYADMKSVTDTGELVIARGEGSYVFDEDGRRYLDLSASLWYCLIGHGRREMAEAAADQMLRLEAYSTERMWVVLPALLPPFRLGGGVGSGPGSRPDLRIG